MSRSSSALGGVTATATYNPSNQVSWTTVNSASSGFIYDAAGNVTNDNVNQYLYDGEGRICAVRSTPVAGFTTMTGYLYAGVPVDRSTSTGRDAEGTRVAKGTITQFTCDFNSADSTYNGFMASGNETDYILGPGGEQVTEMAEQADGSMEAQHINVWAGGKLLATYDPNGQHFYLDDPLGSRRAQTDATGVREQTCASLPFGDGESCLPTPTEHLFTGKERDSESGNDYFGARYYASSMGRWLSPDWSEQPQAIPYVDMENPQTLNLYGYVGNNPLSRRDSDGHKCDPDTSYFDNNGNMHVIGGKCTLDWWDFPGHAWVGFGMLITAHNTEQAKIGAAHMAYAYAGEFITGYAVGAVIQGVGRVVRSAGGKIVVERVMSRAELAATEKSGLLRGGREGTHYVTDSVGTDSSLGAQDRLALPNTPEVKVQLEMDSSALSKSSTVQPAYGQAGGGTERTATGNVSVKILSVQDLK